MSQMSSLTRRRYSQARDALDELIARRAARISRRVKKKRKVKAKKKRRPNLRPYLGLIVALKKSTRRKDGTNIKFDGNYVFTFTDPVKYGPAGKTEGIPVFVGTAVKSPIVAECVKTYKHKRMFERFMRKISEAMV